MKFFRNNIHIILFFLLFIITFGLLLPLLKPGFIVTDDGNWMVIRLTAFYQSLTDGQFPVRFLMRLNNHYGYPVSNFLYPGYLYIGSMLRLFHISFPTIVELICAASILIGAVFTYLRLTRTYSSLAGFFGAVTFSLAPYLLFDLYRRGSVGEILCIASCSILLWALESGFFFLLSPLFALLLISHNTLALLMSVYIIGYSIMKRLTRSILPLLIGGIMAAFFWLPAIVERVFVRFSTTAVANPIDYMQLSTTLVFLSAPFLIGVGGMVLQRKKSLYPFFIYQAGILLLSLGIASRWGSFIWSSQLFIQYIQFPFRILALTVFVGPYIVAHFLDTQKGMKGVVWGILVVTLFVVANLPLLTKVKSVSYDEGYYTTNEGTTTVQDEYMPVWVMRKPAVRAKERIVFFGGHGEIIPLIETTKRIDANLRIENDAILQVNTVYYPGWGGVLDGRPIPLSYKNPEGLIRIAVPKGIHHLSLEFRETGFRYLADILSSLGVVLYGIYLLVTTLRGIPKKKTVWI